RFIPGPRSWSILPAGLRSLCAGTAASCKLPSKGRRQPGRSKFPVFEPESDSNCISLLKRLLGRGPCTDSLLSYRSFVSAKMQTKKRVILGLVAIAVVAGGWKLNDIRHEVGGLRNMLSITYWKAHLNHTDLYAPNARMLKHGSREYKEVALTID